MGAHYTRVNTVLANAEKTVFSKLVFKPLTHALACVPGDYCYLRRIALHMYSTK